MKSILISIKPKYVAKILNGEKTIEIRGDAPKCTLPIDVYIYCTKGAYIGYLSKKYVGKVVAKFTLKRIDDIGKYAYAFKDNFFYETLKSACLTTEDFTRYAHMTRDEFERKGMKLYAWHISDLQLLDNLMKPSGFDNLMELSDFGLKRAPQSWCYVGEEDEKN